MRFLELARVPRGRRSAVACTLVTALALFLLPVLLAPAPALAEPVTQAQWARMLAGAMGLAGAIDPTGKDDAVLIEFLSGNPATPIRVWGVSADPFPEAAQRLPEGAPPEQAWVRAGETPVTARYRVSVPHPGIYALRFRGAGGMQRWRIDGEEARLGDPTGTPEGVGGDSDEADLLGYFVLSAGEHVVTVEVPQGGILRWFVLLRQPFPHIRPPGGWRPAAPLTFGDKAVTMIQAMQLEHELPDVARWRIQREAERYDADPRPAIQTNQGPRQKPSADLLVKGANDGSRVRYRVEIPRPGTYTLLARVTGTGGGRLLLNRGVERAWAAPRRTDSLVWNQLATLPLDAGQQDLDVHLDAGAGLDVLRLVYRDPDPRTSLALLEDLGFAESSAERTVSMAAALENIENARFIEQVNVLVAGFFTQPGPGLGAPEAPFDTEPTGLVLPDISP